MQLTVSPQEATVQHVLWLASGLLVLYLAGFLLCLVAAAPCPY